MWGCGYPSASRSLRTEAASWQQHIEEKEVVSVLATHSLWLKVSKKSKFGYAAAAAALGFSIAWALACVE